LKEFEVTKSVKYGDIAVLYDLFKQYGLIELLNEFIPMRELPVGKVFAALAINHIIDRETLNKFSKWYQDTELEELTDITSKKLNSTNIGAVMKTCGKIGPEGIVDVCIELFNKIKHLEAESSTMIYDLTSTYFGKDVIEKIFDCFKNCLDFGGEKRDKNSVLTKEQKEIIEKLGFADALFGS